MVNAQLLDEKITLSGLKISFIIEKIGISKAAFYNKLNNRTKFRASEIYVICDLLNLSEEDKLKIFFAH